MRIGVPKEIKTNEYRVSLVPGGAEALVRNGHQVFVEKGAGDGSGFADDLYVQAGASILDTAAEVWATAEMILKVKEPIEPEWKHIREEFAKLAGEGLSADELREVKDQVKGQVMLSLENTASRLFRLAGFALYDQPRLTLDQLLDRIESVTRDQVMEAAERSFHPERQAVLRLGPS